MINQKNKFKSHYLGFNLFLCLFLIGATFLTSCHFPSRIDMDSDLFDNESDYSTPLVNLHFSLSLPSQIQEKEKIALEIVDDVTGLPYNTKIILMRKESGLTYRTVLPVPAGSVVKYRYNKITDILIPETTPNNETILYRIAYAANHTFIQDIIQSWQDEVYAGGAGLLQGSVVSSDNNQPAADILVSAGGQRTFTDANGNYQIEGLGSGVHNVVFYAIDGQFRTFQQGALIEQGKITLADADLERMPKVKVSFNVTPPNDALGVPIYIAGNIRQLGNTFAELSGGMSVKPKRMPSLQLKSDGSMSISLTLFAGTDLRYKFTLGDGYWNAEQKRDGGFRTRQLIVPDEDVIINQTIETWRSPNVEPVSFEVSIPAKLSPTESKYIQFKNQDWMEPIPLWPLGNNQYLFILFSPLEKNQAILYRFCRNEDCVHARDAGSLEFERQILVEPSEQNISLTLDNWQNLYQFKSNDTVIESYIPQKTPSYQTMLELTPEMDPSWLILFPQGITSVDQMGANSVIISPQWFIKSNSPYPHPVIGKTPFAFELSGLLAETKAQGFQVGLFPQLAPFNLLENWWSSTSQGELWRESFFTSYREFLLNYAKIAKQSQADYLFIGGKSVLPAINSSSENEFEDLTAFSTSHEEWVNLIKETREIFQGELIWATNANRNMDPLPSFIDQFDRIYISIDSPLALEEQPSFEGIQAGFINLIDSEIYEVYRSTGKPITLAFGYPALSSSASGCALFGDRCFNDGLFRLEQIDTLPVDFEQQSLVYNAIFPILASRDWVSGASIRGYEPIVDIHSGSSAIGGRPASDVIKYWFTNLIP